MSFVPVDPVSAGNPVIVPLSAPEWKSRVAAAEDLAALSDIHAAAVAEGWVSPELMTALTVRKGQLGGKS